MCCVLQRWAFSTPLAAFCSNYGCLECDRETSSAQLEQSAARKYLCRSRVKIAAVPQVQLVSLWQVGRKPVSTQPVRT